MNARIYRLALGLALGAVMAAAPVAMAASPVYRVRNLVSDVPGAAEHTDPHLVNGWGVAFNPFGFAWVASNGKGVSVLYDGDGNANPLVVTIPGGAPTGIVYNGSTDSVATRGRVSGPARAISATEAGACAAWPPTVA